MMRDHRPPFLNSQTLKVLVKPAGPHHRDKRSGSLIAAKTCPTVAGIARDVSNVVIVFFVLAIYRQVLEILRLIQREVKTVNRWAGHHGKSILSQRWRFDAEEGHHFSARNRHKRASKIL
jgi:hypothetical protein